MCKKITLNICGEKWKVLFRRPSEKDYIGVEEDDIGLCVAEDKKIFVDPAPDDVLSTSLHEVLHAVFPQLSEDAIIDGEAALMDLINKFPQELLNENTKTR